MGHETEMEEIAAIGSGRSRAMDLWAAALAETGGEQREFVEVQQDAMRVTPYFYDGLSSAKQEQDLPQRIQHEANTDADEAEESKGFWGKLWDAVEEWFYPGSNDAKEESPHVPSGPIGKEAVESAASRYTAKDVESFLASMRTMIDQLKEMNEDEFRDLQLEQLMRDAFMGQVDEKEEVCRDKREEVVDKYKKRLELNKERVAKLEKFTEEVRQEKLWSTFEKALVGAGLVSAASSGAFSNPVSAVAFFIGVGLTADQLLGDKAKKFIAEKTTGSLDQEKKVLGYLQVGCGIASGIALLVAGGANSFNSMISFANGTSTCVQAIITQKGQRHEADRKENEESIRVAGDDIKKASGDMKSSMNRVYDLFRDLGQIEDNMNQTTRSMVAPAA